jgi:hypothetical protein
MITTSIQQTISTNYNNGISRPSLFSTFMNWCQAQQKNRLLWLGVVVATHGCVLTPVTVMAILLAGSNLTLMVLAIISMAIALVTNLAAMPTKYTIPAFVLSILIDLCLITAAVAGGLSLGNTF